MQGSPSTPVGVQYSEVSLKCIIKVVKDSDSNVLIELVSFIGIKGLPANVLLVKFDRKPLKSIPKIIVEVYLGSVIINVMNNPSLVNIFFSSKYSE
jgi:hypothetical protein